MKKGKYTWLLILAAALLLAAGCEQEQVPVTGIKLSGSSYTLDKGEKLLIEAVLLPENATSGMKMTWTSDNEEAVTVSDIGLISAVGTGEATITAETADGVTATCHVTVEDNAEEIVPERNRLDIMLGSSHEVSVSDRPVTLTSADPDVARIEGSTIISVAPGRTEVTVTSGDSSEEFIVTVADYFGHGNDDLEVQIKDLAGKTKLTIGGKLSYKDFRYLADMADLETLDLSLMDIYELPQQGLQNANIKTAVLPEGITEIPYAFFYGSKIESLDIPSSVMKIGSYAFGGTKALGSIVLPSRLYELGEFAFTGSSLESIIIPGTVGTIGNSVFYGCTDLKSAELSEGVQSIGNSTFYMSGLEKVTLPTTLNEIGPYAFYLCQLETIEIPENVTTIGSLAFYGNGYLKSARLPDRLKRIEYNTFGSCTKLKEVNLPSKLEYIGPAAFRDCPVTTMDGILHIPAGVTEIGDSAFGFLDSMTTANTKSKVTVIKFNDELTKIGQHAFDNMPYIRTLDFPASLTGLSDTAIPTNVTEVTFRGDAVPEVLITYSEAAEPEPVAPDTSWMKNVAVRVPGSMLDEWKDGVWGSMGYTGYGEKITYFDPDNIAPISPAP